MTRISKSLRIFVFLLFAGMVQGQGIVFDHGDWAAVLARASAEKKYVFLDAYTVWCGPCKLMAAKTFTDTTVGAWFNRHFVSVKIDMEKGEGPALARQYGVDLYPTLLFIDSTGAIRHRAAGYYNVPEFLALGALALDPQRNLSGLIRRYRGGERSPELLHDLAFAKSAAFDPTSADLAEEYLKVQKDLGAGTAMDLIFRLIENPLSAGFQYLVRNKSAFQQRFGEKETAEKIDQAFESYLEKNPKLPLGEIQRVYGICYPEKGARLASAYRLTYFKQRGDYFRFGEAAIDHYRLYPCDDADELQEIAQMFVEYVANSAQLKQAQIWIERSVALQETAYNRATQARLYQKTGQTKKAKKAAARAVELAKAAGEDYGAMEEILKGK